MSQQPPSARIILAPWFKRRRWPRQQVYSWTAHLDGIRYMGGTCTYRKIPAFVRALNESRRAAPVRRSHPDTTGDRET